MPPRVRYELRRSNHHRYGLEIADVATGVVVARYYATSEESARRHCAELNSGNCRAGREYCGRTRPAAPRLPNTTGGGIMPLRLKTLPPEFQGSRPPPRPKKRAAPRLPRQPLEKD